MKDNKERIVKTRITKSEWEQMEGLLEKYDMRMSEFLRKAIYDEMEKLK